MRGYVVIVQENGDVGMWKLCGELSFSHDESYLYMGLRPSISILILIFPPLLLLPRIISIV